MCVVLKLNACLNSQLFHKVLMYASLFMSGTFSYNTVQLYPPLLKVHYASKILSYIVCMLLIHLVKDLLSMILVF